jgi:protein-tyrosine-phosphatase
MKMSLFDGKFTQEDDEDEMNMTNIPQDIIESREALLPCPFCDNKNEPKIVSSYDMEQEDLGNDEYFAVFCDAGNDLRGVHKGCGASGGYAKSKELAITKWNTRATPQQPNIPAELTDDVIHNLIVKYHPKALKGTKRFEVTDWYRFAKAIEKAMLSAAPSAPDATQSQAVKDALEAVERIADNAYNSLIAPQNGWDLRDSTQAHHSGFQEAAKEISHAIRKLITPDTQAKDGE